jgi:hypothetical protein
MENAAQAGRGLPPADAALASAIAGETLRRLPDLDALIDGATRQRLPDDSKARAVLRLALAQKIGNYCSLAALSLVQLAFEANSISFQIIIQTQRCAV